MLGEESDHLLTWGRCGVTVVKNGASCCLEAQQSSTAAPLDWEQNQRDEPLERALQVLRLGGPCCLPLLMLVFPLLWPFLWQILIRNRATDLDARMHDGTTPLILAARLAVEGMLDDLINCHADVNAVDDLGTEAAKTPVHPDMGQKGCLLLISALPNVCCISWFSSPGKSALHWAAAVNNVEAAMVLLKNGANKDMQNNKVGSPKPIYAREEPFGESVKEQFLAKIQMSGTETLI